jgi:hypothetical protein
MPEGMMMPGQGAAPAMGAPPAPPGEQQQQATGPTPASMPSPNRGQEAAALAKIAVLTQGLQQLLTAFPVGSDVSKDLREAVNKLAKHVPPGAVSQGVQMTEAQRALMQQRSQAPQIAAMRASQMGGGAPAQPTPPPMPAAAA